VGRCAVRHRFGDTAAGLSTGEVTGTERGATQNWKSNAGSSRDRNGAPDAKDISVLKRRHGLARSRYRGSDGMRRWVGLGIIADNLINLGRWLAKPLFGIRMSCLDHHGVLRLAADSTTQTVNRVVPLSLTQQLLLPSRAEIGRTQLGHKTQCLESETCGNREN
jgi:hypothetical protein